MVEKNRGISWFFGKQNPHDLVMDWKYRVRNKETNIVCFSLYMELSCTLCFELAFFSLNNIV